jgi:hypothetical protein
MAQRGSQDFWAQGWGVVRQVNEKLEFVAFFEAREDAEAAAADAEDCQVCWLTYRDGLGFRPKGGVVSEIERRAADKSTRAP